MEGLHLNCQYFPEFGRIFCALQNTGANKLHCLVYATALSARMEMLLRGNLSKGVALCLLLLALANEATGQRRKTGRRNYYRLHDDGGNGNSLNEVVHVAAEIISHWSLWV